MKNKNGARNANSFLQKAGVYGFDQLEPVILASLVTEDPLLLIGKAGTGKTYLLNSLSEALALNHKHFNASYLSFDDLIGFPYPAANGQTVSFIPTPATIWDAESILIDELSRCKPEIQNKFFSIIQEKKIQGIELGKLRYRWAAMNPISTEISNHDDYYEGSISLDQALADRFAFILDVPDWNEMSNADQLRIIQPAGEGAISELSVDLSVFIASIKKEFDQLIINPPYEIIKYCQAVTTLMTDAGYRISPRRARLMARNFTALFLVLYEPGAEIPQKERSRVFKLGFRWSLPQRAFKNTKDIGHVIDTVHQSAITIAFESSKEDRWLLDFRNSDSLPRKIRMLLDDKVAAEYKSIAVIQFLHTASLKDKAIFAFSTEPYFREHEILNKEGMNALSETAAKLYHVRGTLEWTEYQDVNNTMHPNWSPCAKYLSGIPMTEGRRKKRLKQVLLFLVLNKYPIDDPCVIENELNDCLTRIRFYAEATN